jgi:hypothetical protein
MAKNEPAHAGRNFRVLHTQLGAWPKGHVLSESDLPHPLPAKNADGEPNSPEDRAKAREENLNRLIQLGAIEPVDEPRTGPPPLAPDSMGQPTGDGPKPIAPAAPAAPATRPAPQK